MFHYKQRSSEQEIMDDLEMEGEELATTLRQIAMVNRWLGGSEVALQGLKKLLKNIPKTEQPIRILDIGCGGGEILRLIADWGRKTGRKLELIGMDANLFTINYAAAESKAYPEICFEQVNVFAEEFANLQFDVAICSLFMHHFTNEEIIQLLKIMKPAAKIGLIINDLERSALAHFLFNGVTAILGASKMVRYDGKLSIKRGFIKKDWQELLTAVPVDKYSIQWKWAFRHQIIIPKTK